MRQLVWFRSDLRVGDNTALFRACARARETGDGVIGAFTVCPSQWRDEHHWGDPKADFVLRTVAALREGLAEINVPLKVLVFPTFRDAPERLLGLAKELGCGALHFNREYELNERRRDEAVTEAFEAAGLEVHAYTDQVLYEPGSVKTQEGNPYSVYSPFKRACYAKHEAGVTPEPMGSPDAVAAIDVASDEVPGSVEGFDSKGEGVRPDLWPAGERAAQERLGRFVEERVERYKVDRDFPATPGTSELSPYLAVGSVSPRQCMRAALDANGGRIDQGGKGAVSWISEILWREFYKHLIVAHPKLCMGKAFKADMDSVSWSYDAKAFERWCEGRTGYPIVDAGMRQLNQTGWMHNRLRMIVAMFLTKDLMIDWRWGERYFCRRLVDLDFASNNGGWQWSASTGTDAQPYFRIFNPTLQSKKFDPKGEYVRMFVPELEVVTGKDVHEPKNGTLHGVDYPGPIVDHHEARDRAVAAFEQAKGGPGQRLSG